MTKLNDKIAVVTGGNSGIGLAAAKAFVDEGAKVVITGRNQANLDEAVKSLGENATGIKGDVSNISDLDSLFAEVKDLHGKIDVLFVNAGVAKTGPITEVTEAEYNQMFNINVKGLYFTIQKALPLLGDGASIILNASIAGSKGMAGFSVYSATKAAVRSLARTLASELAPSNIRINVISPGPIETPIYDKMDLDEQSKSDLGNNISQMVPLGRFGTPDEVAGPAVFLASSDSSYVTGIELFVDGGMAQV